jgi:hypothetical protein
MYLLIVFVLNTDSLDFLILIPNLCILWINLDLQIFIKSNGLYSSLFWINVGISRPSRQTWWLLLTLKYKYNRFILSSFSLRNRFVGDTFMAIAYQQDNPVILTYIINYVGDIHTQLSTLLARSKKNSCKNIMHSLETLGKLQKAKRLLNCRLKTKLYSLHFENYSFFYLAFLGS